MEIIGNLWYGMERSYISYQKELKPMTEKIYWNKDIETMELDKMKALQSERLVKQVRHVWDHVPYYGEEGSYSR